MAQKKNSGPRCATAGVAQLEPVRQASTDLREWLRVTLWSIGDAVITTDAHGRVTFLNPVAQALTGWTQEEAVGAPLERVFQIVNEVTRAPLENPVLRSLREGVVAGLTDHTLLISRDGTERPIGAIAEVAAPVRDEKGNVDGVVLVFRDVTERRRQKKLVREALEHAENILATQKEPYLVLDTCLRVISGNRSFYNTFRVEKEQCEGRFVFELGNGQWNIPRLRELLEEVLPQNHAFDDFEVNHDFEGIGHKFMLLNARRMCDSGNHSELILLAIEDITIRKRSEALLASQNDVLALAADGAAMDDVLLLIVRSAQQLSGDRSRAALFIVDPDGKHLHPSASAGMSEVYLNAVDGFGIGSGFPSCGLAAFTGNPVIVADVTKDPLWVPFLGLAKEHDFRACWSYPIRTSGGKVLGTIATYYRMPCEPEPGDLDAVGLLSHTAAIVIERHKELEQRTRTEEALRSSEVRYRRLFQGAKDGILILDVDSGKIIDANAFMSALVGLEAHELLGKELYEIGLFKDIEENKEAFRELQRTGYLRHEDLPLQNQRGETVEVEFVSNIYQEGSKLVAQCNVRDISARVTMERKIKQQTEALADESRRKDEFLAMLSHELRNPLAPIRSAVHLLKLNERGSENLIQQQAREIIERQVGNLTKLVSDLLEVSRVVSGRIRLEKQIVDMNQIVAQALETAKPLIEQHKHTLTLNLCRDPVWASADVTRMEEVFINLLNNAAKYTPDGGRIEVHCEHPRGENHALVRVRDSGIGIDEKLLPRIFDLFTQADRSLDRAAGGLGIGLSLAHRLVDLHGGTIEAQSPPEGSDTGSEFIVRLPLAPIPEIPSGPSTPAPASLGAEHKSEGVRVLVVDDNVDLVSMLACALRHKGYTSQFAYNGADGLKIALQWRPDIALLDIGLPGLDGYEVARRLRSEPEMQDVRLIALTGYGRDADIALAREAGFDAHLVKPFDLDDLEKLMTTKSRRGRTR